MALFFSQSAGKVFRLMRSRNARPGGVGSAPASMDFGRMQEIYALYGQGVISFSTVSARILLETTYRI